MLSFARTGLQGVRLVGLTDPDLGALADADRSLFDAVRTNAYTGAMTEPSGFVQFSPMTHDPLFVAGLLNHRAIPSAAVVHDPIPLEMPDGALAAPGSSLEYHVALRWLARHELLLPVSQEVAASLMARLGVPATRMAVSEAEFESVVAARFWGAVRRLRPTVAPAAPRGRARVALLTPLPPDRSRVAAYSAASTAELARRVDLHVLTPTVDPIRPAGAVSVGPLSAQALTLGRFDRVVAVLGNSASYLDIWRQLYRHGGAAILHDGRMMYTYVEHVGVERAEHLAERELGRPPRSNEIWEWLAGGAPHAATLLSEIAAAAEPLAMHSRAAVTEATQRFGITAAHLPFSVDPSVAPEERPAGERAAARARLGVEAGQVLVATFGHVQSAKAPIDCIWALALIRSWGVDARLHFVGSPLMETAELDALIEQLGLGAWVMLPDRCVVEGSYRDHLAAADVGLQLRVGHPGVVSRALADCIGAGLPTVASAKLAAALDAPDFVLPVPDAPSPVLLAEAVMASLEHGPTAAARLDYVARHGFVQYIDQLMAALNLP